MNIINSTARTEPLPSVCTIFTVMKSQEENWGAKNDNEYGETNYIGKFGGGSTVGVNGSDWQRRLKL